MLFAKVILPLPLPDTYTYSVPEEMQDWIEPGHCVEVQFGKSKLYTAVIESLSKEVPQGYIPKPILATLSTQPVVKAIHIRFWKWMTEYYMCTLGDIMNAALPALYRLNSETRIVLHGSFDGDFTALDDSAYLVAEALTMQKELSLGDVQLILQRKTVQPIIRTLIDNKVAVIYEELKPAYKPKTRSYITLNPELEDEDKMRNVFDQLEKKAPKQLAVLMTWIQMSRDAEIVYKAQLIQKSGAGPSSFKALITKGIFELKEATVSRLEDGGAEGELFELNEAQNVALSEIEALFEQKNTVLLHGVTSSGKTAVYTHLMHKTAKQGKQALYLVPEIALTAQLTARLRRTFGDRLGIYHSKFNHSERVEIWNNIANGEYDFVIGPRSALFLPFKDLGLVIVDESHDSSYKQFDPAPRYHARDAAIWLAGKFGGKTLLGTATPSMESYTNALSGKFGLVKLMTRYAGQSLPEIKVVDLKREAHRKLLDGHLSSVLTTRIEQALEVGEQAILFQNRRGYSPVLRCDVCAWMPSCINCDINLTYHKFLNHLSCHLCGFKRANVQACPACGNTHLTYQGFGTEKIEDELSEKFPNARIARMDLDSISGKKGHERLIASFEQREIDILVGTQMVTKGLDFEGVSVVGVLSADQLLYFPDFRASERAFQLMSQVAGRAGRAGHGDVLIQTWSPDHIIIQQVIRHDFESFYQTELMHRKKWNYPPYFRIIRITLKHRDPGLTLDAGKVMSRKLIDALRNRVLGPAAPPVGRIRGLYLQEIILKLEKSTDMQKMARAAIRNSINYLKEDKSLRRVRVVVNVDPA